MKMNEIINDNKFKSILNSYSGDDKMAEKLSSIIEKINNKEIIIPVLGMQGMGKSTLINAMLKENILPNEADETTCVPVEVKYGENEEALVYFKNSDNVEKAFTTEDLKKYVDNAYNQGNEKGVSHIVLYKKADLLKNGVTIVDLPGVGSLTKENQDTTMRYIENLCTAIFVIPTVPTIRKTEEIFIKVVWSQFNSAIFVQNNFGESNREVKESIEFNSLVLKSIAESINVPYDGKIEVVNAYDGIYGALHNDEQMVISSNINSLIDKIEQVVSNWSENEEKNINSRIKLVIKVCKSKIEDLKEKSQMSKEELEEKLKKEEEIFDTENKKLVRFIDEIKMDLVKKEIEIWNFAKEEAKQCAENIRSSMYKIIDSGVVDGPMLTEAFTDYQKTYLTDVANNFYDLIQKLKYELIESIDELENDLQVNNRINIGTIDFDNGDAFKFEKGLEWGIDILGIFVGGNIFKYIGGGLPGILLGTAVTFVSGIIGNKTKGFIISNRANKAKSQISPIIDDIEDEIKKNIRSSYEEMSNNITSILDDYKDSRKKKLKEMKAKNIEILKKENKPEFDIQQLEKDYNYLCSKEKMLYE